MQTASFQLPLPLRLLNRFEHRLKPVSLDATSVLAAVDQKTGQADLLPPHVVSALEVLTHAYETEANLHFLAACGFAVCWSMP